MFPFSLEIRNILIRQFNDSREDIYLRYYPQPSF